MEELQSPNFLEDCFYVCREALRDVQTLAQSITMSKFSALARELNYCHILADHLCVGTTGSARAEQASPLISLGQAKRALDALQHTVAKREINWQPPPLARSVKPRHLHVMHSWGGGLEKWVYEYCRADEQHHNFILKSIGDTEAFGRQLALFRDIDDPVPMKTWPISPAIKGTITAHSGYESALSELLQQYGIERILVSSLIGHSLDALRADPPTIMICHDYYPFCPALNITFHELCTTCARDRLAACTVSNPYNRFFNNLPPGEWLDTRDAFTQKIRGGRITMVAPTPSVPASYTRLAPDLAGCFQVIPHGTRPLKRPPVEKLSQSAVPRIVILGRLGPQKGLDLLKQIRERLEAIAEVFLVGSGQEGEGFRSSRTTVIENYTWDQLPVVLGEIHPDIALLLSVVPETFSYTLQELFELGIPVVAPRIGSFQDRIQDGITGFLCEPSADSVIGRLQDALGNRDTLSRVQENLRNIKIREVSEMLQDYNVLLGSRAPSGTAYFCADARTSAAPLASPNSSSIENRDQWDRLLVLAQSDVLELKQTIAGVVSSRSWKLTEPARIAARLARSVLGFRRDSAQRGARKRED
jgi:glycosyltransferase involved in cell wall biosynthesis